MKSWWGDNATAENNFGFDYLPKLDKSYDMLQVFELMDQGKMNGYIAQGFNPLAAAPNKAKIGRGSVEAEVARHHGPARDRNLRVLEELSASSTTSMRRRSRLKCSVCRPPASRKSAARSSVRAACCSGTGRAQTAPGEAKSDLEIMSGLWLRIRKAYQGQGRQVSRSDPQDELAVCGPGKPDARRNRDGVQRQGARRRDRPDRQDQGAREEGRATGELRAIARRRQRPRAAAGSSAVRGRRRATRWAGATTPTRPASASTLGWAWAWPANRRILYNRASCDVSGKPFDPTRKLIAWNGKAWTRRRHSRLQGGRAA